MDNTDIPVYKKYVIQLSDWDETVNLNYAISIISAS